MSSWLCFVLERQCRWQVGVCSFAGRWGGGGGLEGSGKRGERGICTVRERGRMA